MLTLGAMITSASCLGVSRRPVLHRESEWEGGMKKQMVLAVSLKAVIVRLSAVVTEIRIEGLRVFSGYHTVC